MLVVFTSRSTLIFAVADEEIRDGILQPHMDRSVIDYSCAYICKHKCIRMVCVVYKIAGSKFRKQEKSCERKGEGKRLFVMNRFDSVWRKSTALAYLE